MRVKCSLYGHLEINVATGTHENAIKILYIFFWVFPRRQIVVGRRFGTLCQFHLQPLKMELTQGSETSANYNLTPGKYPKEYIQYSNHGESLKSSYKNKL